MYVTATRAGNLPGCEPFGAYRGLEDDQVVPDGESGNITRTSPAIHCLDANQTVAVAINNHIPRRRRRQEPAGSLGRADLVRLGIRCRCHAEHGHCEKASDQRLHLA
jgi:hypothetical protein